jgi:hypothetical protein
MRRRGRFTCGTHTPPQPSDASASCAQRTRKRRAFRAAGHQLEVVGPGALRHGEAPGPVTVKLPVCPAQHPVALEPHRYVAVVVLLPGARALAGPARIVLPAVDFDVDVLGYLEIQSADPATVRLRDRGDPGIREPQAHKGFAVGLIKPTDQRAPALGTERGASEDGVHSPLRPVFGSENSRTTGDGNVPVGRAQHPN